MRKLYTLINSFGGFATRFLFWLRDLRRFDRLRGLDDSLWLSCSFRLISLRNLSLSWCLNNFWSFRRFSRSLWFNGLFHIFFLYGSWLNWFRFANSFWFFHYLRFYNLLLNNSFFLFSTFSFFVLLLLLILRFNFIFYFRLIFCLFSRFCIILVCWFFLSGSFRLLLFF